MRMRIVPKSAPGTQVDLVKRLFRNQPWHHYWRYRARKLFHKIYTYN